MTQPSVAQVLACQWRERATFSARVVALERALQADLDRLQDAPFTPRVPVTVRLTLDELSCLGFPGSGAGRQQGGGGPSRRRSRRNDPQPIRNLRGRG